MKTLLLTLAASVFLLAPGLHAQDEPTVKVSTLRHTDGSRTDTETNFETKTSEEKKYNPQGHLVSKIVYQLDEENRPTGGTHYNDKDVQLYNFTYTRDALGRIIEEKDYSPDGKLIQRFTFLFTTDGKVAGIRTYDGEGNLVSETSRRNTGGIAPDGTSSRKLQRRTPNNR